jgi:predicted metal-binding membrane protein
MTVTAGDAVLEAILWRDRQVVVALIVVIAMAWVWILLGAGTGRSAMDVIVGLSPDHMASIMAPGVSS